MKLAALCSPLRQAISRSVSRPSNAHCLRAAPAMMRRGEECAHTDAPAPKQQKGGMRRRRRGGFAPQMEDMMGDFRLLSPLIETALHIPTTTMSLAVDVKDEDNAYIISADTPGMKRGEIKVEVSPDRVLSISGERKAEEKTEDKEKGFVRVERTYGSFSRSFKLPEHVDVAGIKAELNEGVLQLTVPKAEVAEEKKTIAIDVGGEK